MPGTAKPGQRHTNDNPPQKLEGRRQNSLRPFIKRARGDTRFDVSELRCLLSANLAGGARTRFECVRYRELGSLEAGSALTTTIKDRERGSKMNENKDDFNGIPIKLIDETKIGKLTTVQHVDRDRSVQKVYEINYRDKCVGDVISGEMNLTSTHFGERMYEVLGIPKEFSEPLVGTCATSIRIIDDLTKRQSFLRDLCYFDLLVKANARIFYDRHAHNMTESERKHFMEKYGVQTDPKKIADAKKKAAGEKTASVNDPNVNVPKDNDLGTEPFEKEAKDD